LLVEWGCTPCSRVRVCKPKPAMGRACRGKAVTGGYACVTPVREWGMCGNVCVGIGAQIPLIIPGCMLLFIADLHLHFMSFEVAVRAANAQRGCACVVVEAAPPPRPCPRPA
jgi:hypothetical protein